MSLFLFLFIYLFLFFPFQKFFFYNNTKIYKKQLHKSNIKITIVKIHTHRKKKHVKNLKKKQQTNKQKKPAPSSLPKKKEDTHNIPDGAPYGKSQGIEPSTAAARTPTPEAVGILDFLHFYVSAT